MSDGETQEEKGWAAAQYILGRLKEPSTMAGIALFVGFFGVSEETFNRASANLPAIITALTALAAIFAPSGARKALERASQADAKAETALQVTGADVAADRIRRSAEQAGDGQL